MDRIPVTNSAVRGNRLARMIADFDVVEDCGRQTAPRGAPRILVVDSDPIMRDLMERILWSEGFGTAVASDCHQAMEVFRTAPVDLILMEMVLAGSGGVEVCRRLQADRSMRDIPVIFISSLDDP